MSTSNVGGRPRRWRLPVRVWPAVLMASWLTACASPGGAGEAATSRQRTGRITTVGPLGELQPTRPDRCARPAAEFDGQRGYVVMYRSQVGYRTRVVALKGGQQASVGEVVSFDDHTCSAIPLRISADSD